VILVESGPTTDASFDSKLLFAAMLAERGHAVLIDEETLPADANRSRRYEALPFLADLGESPPASVLLIGAEDIAALTLQRLRMLGLAATAPVTALGRFADHQAEVATRTKLAYALGREATVVDVDDVLGKGLLTGGLCPLAAPDRPPPPQPPRVPELLLYLPADRLDEPHLLPLLAALDNVPDFRLSVVMSGEAKDRVKRTRHAALNVFSYSELGPAALARRADVAAIFGDGIPGERMAALAVDMMAGGKPVIDCTRDAAFDAAGAPVLRGPAEPAALPNFLAFSVLPNLAAIGSAARQSPWTSARAITRLEAAAGLARPLPARTAARAPDRGRTVFLPTNGSGLGHAQRCTVIARNLARPEDALFLAFPSCVPLVEGRGFPCLPLVQKSADHPDEWANDLVNYARLGRTLTPQDHLVFDGGYVFDSIYRAIHDRGCSATWIRRGLWRPGQVADAPLERERAFRSVLVPEEAFPELNVDYSRGAHVRRVGPIVQPPTPADPSDVRARLSETFGHAFDTLVVTMLGGGVAADRSAQVQAVAGLLEPRPATLHLVVVWPHARVAPGLGGWRNTRLVRTRDTLTLARAADLAISAVGYNTFHELLYNRVPAIFIPQIAAYLDDQERRARAASDRGLAETILAHELLILDRRLRTLLDGGAAALRDALGALDLPATGNAAAARLIEAEAAR
jgi:UDP:flavonoid glycosyltransferase YjiC (YdhE family)